MKNFLFALVFLPSLSFAQFTTPNNGESYTLSDLVTISEGVVTEESGGFFILEDLTISESDSLLILENSIIRIDSTVRITIGGRFEVNSNSLFTNLSDSDYDGFRFEVESSVHLQGATFEYGGGLRALTGDISVINCTIRYQSTGASTSGAIGLSTGKPYITGNVFLENETAAIGSAANGEVAPYIYDNLFQGNTSSNENRPQINLGPSGADTTFILFNVVTGYSNHEMAGGIGISSLLGGESHGVITGNTISNNRYGIAAIGNGLTTLISNNQIENNNTQNDPLFGGSGININASADNSHLILNNIIRGNLWGITIQGNGMVNLGDYEDENIGEGNNTFAENGNEGAIYALYNNTSNPVKAQGNCWIEGQESTAEEVAEVIFDMSDDEALGQVDYSNFLCAVPNGISNLKLTEVAVLFPNPTTGIMNIDLKKPANQIRLMDLRGRTISTIKGEFKDYYTLNLTKLSSGFYIIQISGKDYISEGKILKQ